MKLAATLAFLAALQAGKSKELDWYQFRGPARDGLSPDKGLLSQWPSAGPALAWKAVGLGGGYSSVCVTATRIFTLGEAGGAFNLVALSTEGKLLWTAKIADLPPRDKQSSNERDYPGPRSTPSTDGKFVYALAPYGDLACFDADKGRLIWKRNLKDEFGGTMMSGWGYSESPLLDGNLVVVTPGGSKGTVHAFNKMNGQPVWQSKQLTDSAAYASLVPVEIGRVKQYLVFTDKSVAGVAAANGQVAWKIDRKGETAVIPTPVYKDGIVFVTSGYGVGCNAFQVAGGGGQFKVQQIYSNKDMKNHHGGVVLVGDHVYGFDDGILKCMELKTGKVVWQDRSVGKGSVTYADGHLVCRGEGGPLALVEATPAGYKEKGRFNQPDRSNREAWAHPVVFGGKLYIRDQDVLLCFDVKAK